MKICIVGTGTMGHGIAQVFAQAGHEVLLKGRSEASLAKAHKAMDMYNMIEDVAAIGAVPLTPYGTPSTTEVPDAIEPYLEEHDVMLLENHGALAVGSDVITAFYRMESLELWAKITINAVILGGSHDIDEKNIQKLIDLRSYYKITGRHPGHKMYNPDDEMLHKKEN